jgi:hypothetical protein
MYHLKYGYATAICCRQVEITSQLSINMNITDIQIYARCEWQILAEPQERGEGALFYFHGRMGALCEGYRSVPLATTYLATEAFGNGGLALIPAETLMKGSHDSHLIA